MRFSVYWSAIILLLVCATSPGKSCSPEGLLSVEDLLDVQQSSMLPAVTSKQWLFPSLEFTCTITVTAWLFAVKAPNDTNVVCPTLELWTELEATPGVLTDYDRVNQLTPASYHEPEAISEYVYSCTLLTPLVVSAGTVLGFLTNDSSKIQLMNITDSSLTGYHQPIALQASFFNTDISYVNEVTGSVPLISPLVMMIESSAETNSPQTSVVHLHPTITVSSHYVISSTSARSSDPMPTTSSDIQTTDEPSPSKSNVPPSIIGIVVVIVILIVVAIIVLLLVIILLVTKRKKSSQPSEVVVNSEAHVPSTTKISRVRSKNNYEFKMDFTENHIYEDVDGMSLRRKTEDHDYELINSTPVAPDDDPVSYEVPQTSPSKTSSAGNSSLYEVPGTITDKHTTPIINTSYDTPIIDTRGPIPIPSVESGYDTPIIDTRGPIPIPSVESGYGTPIDAQLSQRNVKTMIEEGVYETPTDLSQTDDIDPSGIYEDVTID